MAQEAGPAPCRAGRGRRAVSPRVVLRLPDLSDHLAEGIDGGHAAWSQGELPTEIALPPLEEGSPWPDTLQGGSATDGGVRAYERAFASAAICRGGGAVDGGRASTPECDVQPGAQPVALAASPLSRPVAMPACLGATGPTSHTRPGEGVPPLTRAIPAATVAARRALQSFEGELHRARNLAGKVARRISAVPWKKVLSLAGWLGLLQQPRMWLTAATAAVAQIVLAMLFLGSDPSKDPGGADVSPARSARAASSAESSREGRAPNGFATGLTEAAASRGEPEAQLARRSSRETGATVRWERDILSPTASGVAVQSEGDGTRGGRSAYHRQADGVRRPGSAQLQGIIQEGDEGRTVP